jgi:hypothetical protein
MALQYGLSPQQSRPKSQTLRVEQGTPVLRELGRSRTGSGTGTSPGVMTMSASSSPHTSKTVSPATPEMEDTKRPWQEFMGERLQFLAFYVETVVQGTDKARIHHVVIQVSTAVLLGHTLE